MSGDAETECNLSLEKNRRSGLIDRRDPDSAHRFREEIGREYRLEIRQLRDEGTRKDLEIAELKSDIAGLKAWQQSKERVLLAADQIVSAGTAFKWVIGLIIGATMMIGGISASIEIIRSWAR
jgi:hypothetical protein